MVVRSVFLLLLCATVPASAETIQGRWKLVAAEDLRADGSVGRYPWGRHPAGSIVVDGGSCYVQSMSTDVPSFSAQTPVGSCTMRLTTPVRPGSTTRPAASPAIPA